jgi:hypothetical protein
VCDVVLLLLPPVFFSAFDLSQETQRRRSFGPCTTTMMGLDQFLDQVKAGVEG